MFYDLSKQKITRVALVILFLGLCVSSSAILLNHFSGISKKGLLGSQVNYLAYKITLAGNTLKEFSLASMIGVFGNEKSLTAQQENRLAQSIPVLLYHGLINEDDGFNTLKINFDEQMFVLKKAGWQTISIDDFGKFVRGKKRLPEKSFLLTFDDGRKDSFYPVDPILRTIGYNAVIFIIAGQTRNYDNKNFLSWQELRYMAKSKRWEIQSHGYDDHGLITVDAGGKKGYFLTNKMWLSEKQRLETMEEYKQRITDDLSAAKNTLAQWLKRNTISFAFPMGDYGLKSVNIPEAENIVLPIVKEIYPLSFFQTWYGNGFLGNYPDATQKNQQSLFRRIEVESAWKADDLLFILEQGLDRTLPFSDNFQTKNSWSVTWGAMEQQNNALKISANASTSGSVAFLDGSYLWQDYDFTAKVNPEPESVFSLLARYQENETYLSCNFSENRVTLQERINSRERKVAQWNLKNGQFFEPSQDINVGMQVVGNRARCLMNGQVILTSPGISSELSHGGIGFRVWNEELGKAELLIKEVKVEEIKSDS